MKRTRNTARRSKTISHLSGQDIQKLELWSIKNNSKELNALDPAVKEQLQEVFKMFLSQTTDYFEGFDHQLVQENQYLFADTDRFLIAQISFDKYNRPKVVIFVNTRGSNFARQLGNQLMFFVHQAHIKYEVISLDGVITQGSRFMNLLKSPTPKSKRPAITPDRELSNEHIKFLIQKSQVVEKDDKRNNDESSFFGS